VLSYLDLQKRKNSNSLSRGGKGGDRRRQVKSYSKGGPRVESDLAAPGVTAGMAKPRGSYWVTAERQVLSNGFNKEARIIR